MGWWMALNLRKALPELTELYVYDLNPSASEKLQAQAAAQGLGTVKICTSCRDVATHSVRESAHSSAVKM